MIYTYITFLPALTPNKKFIERTDCLNLNKSGECLRYSDSYFVPLDSQMYVVLIQSGIITGVLTIGIGSFLAFESKKR